jgi:predicted dehydrogenase
MPEPLGVALVGTGMWGQRLAAALQRTPSLRLVACYSRRPEQREAFASQFGCQAAPDFEALLAQPEVAGVLLVTPNAAHRAGVEACARAGKGIFLEKPIADNLQEGQAIAAACAQAGVTLLVGHAFRRLGASRKVRQLQEEGALGQVVLAEANFSLPGTFTPDKWRAYRETCPGGPLMQLGVHHADTLQYWLGPVARVQGTFAHLAVPADIDDVGVALLEFESGVRGVITGSYVSPKTYELRLYGTQAVLEYHTDMSIWPQAERMDAATTLRLRTREGETLVPFEPRDMLVEELDEFARCLHSGAQPETGAAQALAALEVITGALAAYAGEQVTLAQGQKIPGSS